jgi:hypothetical protein
VILRHRAPRFLSSGHAPSSAGARDAVAALRASWWANLQSQPVLGLFWILAGAVGTYFASELAYVRRCLYLLIKHLSRDPVFTYVPKRQDRSFGWRPVSYLISVIYAGIVTLLFSFAALLYLLHGRLESGASMGEKLFWASQTHELADAPTLPLFGGLRSLVPIVAGLTAILSLIRAVIRL